MTAPAPWEDVCEESRTDDEGLHLCGRNAGHDGQHMCAVFVVCGVAWAHVVIVRADHLGPCGRCGDVVHAGDECSTCLENDGNVVHASECDE